MLHMSFRNWFDDEAFELESDENQNVLNDRKFNEISRPSTIDPFVYKSMKSSLGEARLVDLQKALRTRGLRVVGSKLELQKRLLESLVDDAENLF
jgi:hypothetical protein